MDLKGSIVGDVPLRIPIAGRIRPGFKRLTNEAKQHPAVVKVYEEGLNKGLSFDEIAKKIGETGYKKLPLTPENSPYFTVRRGDFVNAKTADQIIEKYGETRPSHPDIKRVYSLPIILATDNWLDTLPHSLSYFTAAGRHFWAEYEDDGTRVCKTWGPVAPSTDKSERRIYGGRPIILRQDNGSGGKCVPEMCPQYQKRECKLTGSFRFYVAGISGVAMIEIPTTSFYSLTGARNTLALLTAARGRLAGTHNGKAVLWVNKTRESIARYRPDLGRSVQEKQWLIRLESPDFDIADLIGQREAAAVATPRLAAPVPAEAGTVTTIDVEAETVRTVASAASDSQQPTPPQVASTPSVNTEGLADDLDAAIGKITKAFVGCAVDKAVAMAYCTARFGKGWSKDLTKLNELLEEIGQFDDDPEGLAALLRHEEAEV